MMNNIYIKLLTLNDLQALFDNETRNREFFQQYAPERESDFYSLDGQARRITEMEERKEKGLGYSFGIFLQDTHELIGQIGLFKIERGPAQKGMVGYSLDKVHNGKGYMTQALSLLIDFAFHELKLHRIEAEVMPQNMGSIQLLLKAGFHKEGISKKNVKINGRWEDHQVLAILNEEDFDI
ncbi:GNAT family N-acetyltransferase [Fictibacillus phosphorivorans]|uniref:GNAT family N-acetyltransferase n=1 Tax=Fictibacillus phosphorivorans TaxID=1221500 RepID=UPI001292E14E|nr:GNAT family protein [Fictibacillus phosphorivorans]MQR94504.1 N-acetyltransferase [Fictibacillus phosphorivorans]